MNLKINCLIHAAGSGGTQAGIVVGNKALETRIDVIGIATESNGDWLLNTTAQIANQCAKLLDLDLTVTKDDVKILYDYVGEGYGILDEKSKETIKLVARTEGIMLDPVYTSKAMAGLMDLMKKGHFKNYGTIVFLHTGGIPAISAYKDELKLLYKP